MLLTYYRCKQIVFYILIVLWFPINWKRFTAFCCYFILTYLRNIFYQIIFISKSLLSSSTCPPRGGIYFQTQKRFPFYTIFYKIIGMIEQHWSLAEKFLKKGFWLYLFSFIIAPIGYIIKILVSGNIPVSDVWILYWVISLITLLSAFSDLGIGESIKYFIPQYLKKQEYSIIKSILTYGLFIQLFSWFLLFCMLFFWSDVLATHYLKSPESSNVIRIFSLYFLWINIFQILSNFLLAVQNTFLFKLSEFVRNIFILAAVIYMIVWDIGTLWTLSFAWIIGLYIGIVCIIYCFYSTYYKKYLSSEKIFFSKTLLKKIFSYALWVFLTAQAGVILSQIDMQMIIILLDTTNAGYYSIYLSLIMIPFIIIGPIFSLLLPVFSELWAKEEHSKIRSTKNMLANIFLSIGVFFSCILFTFSQQIAYILFGNAFSVSGDILQYSVLFLVFNLLFQINFNILWWIGKVSTKLTITLIALVVNINLNIFFLKYIWVEWAALATGFWWLLIFALSEYILWKKYRLSLNYTNISKNILILSAIWVFSHYSIISYFEGLSRVGSLGLFVWIWIVWLWIFTILNIVEMKKFVLQIRSGRK